MFNFLHTFLPQPILFQFGFLTVYWYGLFVVSAMIVGLFVAVKVAKRLGINHEEMLNLIFYLIIFGLLGARLYAVMLDLPYYLSEPLEMIAVWHCGLAIHGGIIGGLVTLIVYCYKKKQSFWLLADVLALALPLGQAIGRWGNYCNQELFGRPTSSVWGIPIAPQNRPAGYINFTYFQPTFLYESVLNLLNFFILLILFYHFSQPERPRQGVRGVEGSQTLKRVQGDRRGLIALVYLINYSLIRIFMEQFRTDSTPIALGLRLPILVSILIIIISSALIIFLVRVFKKEFPS